MRWSCSILGLLALGAAACQAELVPVEYDKGDGGGCRLDDDYESFRCTLIDVAPRRDVDILFVIDNSGSMGEEQGRLQASIPAFVEMLESDAVRADYRIGITTTDNGNPWCGGTTTPEGGRMLLSSCRGRPDEFFFYNSNDGGTSMFNEGCADHCKLEPEELDDLMRPTTTYLDPEPGLRPWVESIEGVTNLPEDVDMSQALQCFLPQGITGCGFESHLESMYKALQRSETSSEDAYGFLRDDAILAVVILTDEADCSYANDWKEIFETDGNRVFWADPESDYPTSAVCWNAGVECSGGPGSYDECHSANKDVDGEPTDDEDRAVLRPVSRYVDLLAGIRAAKRGLNPNAEVIVSVIGGVPEGYTAEGIGELYADAEDPVFQEDFGIGPGCKAPHSGGLQTGIPPVRMREVAEAFATEEPLLHSVCADDYTAALDAIADQIRSQIRPACYPRCVADTNDGPGLQPDCQLEQHAPGVSAQRIPGCELVDGQWQQPSDADDVCFAYLTDTNESAEPHDDMSDACVEEGWNLEFEIVRREGVPAPPATSITAVCELSDTPTEDCPDLG